MRKVLSFVLVLTLVLSSFSMAFAATPAAAAGLSDIAGNANADAIQVAYDLGIVTGNPDGTFLPGEAVNRAQFAAMLTRALDIPDSALAGYTATTFKDTAGYGWAVPYLAFCQSKGILLGDGNGNVMPGNTITVNEAMTMALRAIGYTANSALLVGAWPANYVSIAQNNDLYDSVAKTTTVDKANAAQIIYNLLTVQKVAVNSDGTTDYLTIRVDGENVEANLLNTNLGCDSEEDVILGDAFDYDNSKISITKDLGAYGTAYTNDDGDLVAFTKDSVALTGKVNEDEDGFEVGDVTYDFGDNSFASPVAITNGDAATDAAIDAADIVAFALANSEDEETVTINVDLSGKKIKDIYSMVAWGEATADLAASDVQEDIADNSILGEDFVTTDDDAIDTNSFELDGVASLDKIATDNVVYVYTDGAGDIRKVAVGTEKVEGTVEETDAPSTVTIGGKDYDIAAASSLAIPADLDVDSEGTFYLDVNGEIYDFSGTAGSTDTYGVVKSYAGEDSFNNFKIKLYKSDDSTKTLYLSESDPADLDWTSYGGVTPTVPAIVTGALIGYSLNADGDIKTINATFDETDDVYFQSTKVMRIDGTSRSVDSNAVVFTYTDKDDPSTYDVAKLSEVDKGDVAGATSEASIILNDDDKVVAMFIDAEFVSVDDEDVYGVLNDRTSAKNGDDEIYKYTGYIDGTEFTKKTDDRDVDVASGTLEVYKITVDVNDVITDAVGLNATEARIDVRSGYLTTGAIITGMNTDKTVLTVTKAGVSSKWTIADDAVVYKFNDSKDEFTVSKLSSLRKDYTVNLYDTKGEDADGIATIVVYEEN